MQLRALFDVSCEQKAVPPQTNAEHQKLIVVRPLAWPYRRGSQHLEVHWPKSLHFTFAQGDQADTTTSKQRLNVDVLFDRRVSGDPHLTDLEVPQQSRDAGEMVSVPVGDRENINTPDRAQPQVGRHDRLTYTERAQQSTKSSMKTAAASTPPARSAFEAWPPTSPTTFTGRSVRESAWKRSSVASPCCRSDGG